jgi:hypothetical protein
LKSAEKRSGKSRLISVLARTVAKPLLVSGITPSALMRVIELHAPTVLLDEIDALMNKNPEMAEALRGLINSTFDRAGAHHTLNVPVPGGGYEPRMFSTWAPMVLSGIGNLQDTVRDRSIEIEMLRKRPDEKVRRLRRRDGADLDILRRKAVTWAAANIEALRDSIPEMPVGLDDRAADAWEPLIAIADAAGGVWPERARAVALNLSGYGTGKEDDSARTKVLADINHAFGEREATQIATADLIENLVAIEGRPWAEWKGGKPITPTGLARLLAPLHIYPTTIRIGDKTPKGYRLADFGDAFERFLPPAPQRGNIEPQHRNKADGTRVSSAFGAATPPPMLRPEKSQKPLRHSDCCGVAAEKPGKPPMEDKKGLNGHNSAARPPAARPEAGAPSQPEVYVFDPPPPPTCAQCTSPDGDLRIYEAMHLNGTRGRVILCAGPCSATWCRIHGVHGLTGGNRVPVSGTNGRASWRGNL